MPKGTRVSRCVDKVKKSKDVGAAIAICQDSTNQGYASGKKLKESLRSLQEKQAAKRVNPGEGDKAGSSDSDEYVSGGKTGKPTIQGRLTGIRTKKASPSAGVRVKNYTAGPKGKLPEQAEAYRDLAYRIDELLPALAAGAARVGAVVGRGAAAAGKGVAKAGGRLIKRKAKKAAINTVKATAERLRDKRVETGPEGVATGGDTAKKQAELGQQADSDKDLEENKMNNSYVRTLMETRASKKTRAAEARAVRKRTKPDRWSHLEGDAKGDHLAREGRAKDAEKEEADAENKAFRKGTMKDHTEYHRIGALMAEAMGFPKGPTAKAYEPKGRAKDTGEGKGTESIKDPLVRKETEKTKANIDKKTQSDTNPKVSDLVQGSMNRRRGQSRRRGTGGFGKESKADARADAQRDKWRRMAPGDK
jgi:hypothetical protein